MNHHKSYSFQSIITEMEGKLAQTIVALQSDEVIQQMRNDKSLYQYKLTHIKEIIAEHFDFQDQIQRLVKQNQQLRESVGIAEQTIMKKDQEFNQAIDMIEESAKKLTHLKDQQINGLKATVRDLEAKLNSKENVTDKVSKKANQLKQTIHSLQEQREGLNKQILKLRDENGRQNELIKKLKGGQKGLEADYERSLASLKSEHQRQIQQYETLVKKMQNDMLIIKSQWQKKCGEVEKGLREFYQGQMMKMEQKKTRQLIQHIQTMKEGKPIIIKQDEQILTSRIESVRRQYENEIQKLQKSRSQIQELYQNLQNAHIPKVKEMETLAEALKGVRSQFQIEKQNWASQKDKSRREIQKLKAIVLQFQRNSKDAVLTSQAKQSEILKLQDTIKFVQKKLQIANRSINELKNNLTTKEDEIEAIKSKNHSLEEINKKSKKGFENIESQLEAKSKKIQSLSKQNDGLNERLTEYEQKLSILKSQMKNMKASKQKFRKAFDRLSIQLKQYQKELLLLKEDLKYSFELQRKKNSTELDKLVTQVETYKESVQKETKLKMNDLINEIEEAKEAQHAQFQSIIRQRDNLKREVVDLEDLFQKKEKEVEETKRSITNAQADEVKRTMLQELQRERLKFQRLQDQLINNEKEYHRRLQRTKGEVKDAVRVLASKWMEEISRLEEENKRKQYELQRIVDKVQIVITQSQEIKRNYENQKQDSRRLRKKYESLKQEKDEQISDIIKRLERESKHKISLQKQLRSIRSELNRGEKNLHQKYFQSENKNQGNTSVTDRQKEITQIRQLIAKTYQAVGEKPEKDTKFQRQRSPF